MVGSTSRTSTRGTSSGHSPGRRARQPTTVERRPFSDLALHAGSLTSKETEMLLATTQIEDFDHFLEIFSTKGAEKRQEHGSQGALIFRDPSEADRVWVVFDWDEQGWQNFVSDPEVPPIMKEAGHKGRPQAAQFAAQCSS